jgi:hypothetical protein
MAKRQSPKQRAQERAYYKNPIARAGNYTAPVDTAGMDPEMKKTLEVDRPRGGKKKKKGK